VEKFRKYRFADIGKSEFGKNKIKKKHAQNNIDRSQNGRSKKSLLELLHVMW